MTETTTPDYELPLLKALAHLGGSVRVPSDALYDHFRRTVGLESEEHDPVHGRPQWVYALQWVRFNLVKQGLMDGSERGVWKLTDAGHKVAEQGTAADIPGPSVPASLRPDDIIHSVTVADLQEIAVADMHRELTPDELRLVVEKFERRLNWPLAATAAIKAVVDAA